MVLNNVLYGEDALVATWINDQFGLTDIWELTTTGFTAMGIIDPSSDAPSLRNRLVAGCYWYNHVDKPHKRDIWVCAAMTEAAASHRTAIRQILRYPFEQHAGR